MAFFSSSLRTCVAGVVSLQRGTTEDIVDNNSNDSNSNSGVGGGAGWQECDESV